jgi:hypothetical protein
MVAVSPAPLGRNRAYLMIIKRDPKKVLEILRPDGVFLSAKLASIGREHFLASSSPASVGSLFQPPARWRSLANHRTVIALP